MFHHFVSQLLDRRTPADVNRIYMAMRSEDLSDCVVTALEVLKENDMANSVFKPRRKSTSKSLENGAKGKRAFYESNYQEALLRYNLALMEAPHNSDVMRSAYYNRAELLLKMKKLSACVKDIETCLALDCPEKMVNELKKMKDEAYKYIWIEKYALEQKKSWFTDQVFKPKGELNPKIPCASLDIEVIMESQKPKVVAARDIPVGTVLALETTFVCSTNVLNLVFQCHYCLKMTLNVMPCDGCCTACFCDENCKKQSMREGHNVECKIIDLLTMENSSRKLAILAVLKMRRMCKSWDELITASHKLGDERMINTSFADIFGSNKFSILNSHDDKHFIYGAMFYSSFYFAFIIHALDTETSFLPSSPEEKSAAIRAISRIMMHLSLNAIAVPIQQYAEVVPRRQICVNKYIDSGYFPFISKLSHSCLSNAYVVGMGNAAALVTCMPIKQGAEVTMPYLGHWLAPFKVENQKRALHILKHYSILCNCIICSGDEILNKQLLNDTQKEAFQRFEVDVNGKKMPSEINLVYKESCKILGLLSDAPYSKEYGLVFKIFVNCLVHYLDGQIRNETM